MMMRTIEVTQEEFDGLQVVPNHEAAVAWAETKGEVSRYKCGTGQWIAYNPKTGEEGLLEVVTPGKPSPEEVRKGFRVLKKVRLYRVRMQTADGGIVEEVASLPGKPGVGAVMQRSGKAVGRVISAERVRARFVMPSPGRN